MATSSAGDPGVSTADADGPGDDGDVPAGDTDGVTDTHTSTPAWLTDDSLIGSPPDRQILVVGDSLAGVTLTGLLRRAGYDPVFLGAADGTDVSSVTCLWPSTLALLGALDVAGPVRECGHPIDSVAVTHVDSRPVETATLSTDHATPPVVARTRGVCRALLDRLVDGAGGRDRRVDALSRRNGALEVRFDDGVREWFDVVVDARAGASPWAGDRDAAPATSMTQYETPVTTERDVRHRLTDVWRPGAFVQVLPDPGNPGAVLRVITGDPERVPGLRDGDWEAVLPGDPGGLRAGTGETEVRDVRQAPVGNAAVGTDWWGTGRVARCGPAALPVAPASGLASTLAVEDAWVLAEELVRGSRSLSAVLDTYVGRRRRRLTDLLRDVDTTRDSAYPVPDDLSAPLSTTGLLRTAALAPFGDPPTSSRRPDAFDRL